MAYPADKASWPRVRITNTDGVGHNTQITMDDGTPLRTFNHAVITIPVDGVVTAQLRVVRPTLHLSAHADPDDLRAVRAEAQAWAAEVDAEVARLLGEEAPDALPG